MRQHALHCEHDRQLRRTGQEAHQSAHLELHLGVGRRRNSRSTLAVDDPNPAFTHDDHNRLRKLQARRSAVHAITAIRNSAEQEVAVYIDTRQSKRKPTALAPRQWQVATEFVVNAVAQRSDHCIAAWHTRKVIGDQQHATHARGLRESAQDVGTFGFDFDVDVLPWIRMNIGGTRQATRQGNIDGLLTARRRHLKGWARIGPGQVLSDARSA